LARAARELSMLGKRLTPDALTRMQRYAWPGNVRQLENLCRRVTALLPGRDVHAADLDELLRSDQVIAGKGSADRDWTEALREWLREHWQNAEPGSLHDTALAAFEQTLFDAALELTDGNRVRAAEHLGLSRNTLTRKLGRKKPS
jgi:two-component system nitrogen regulation response regulator GlnG